MSAQRKRVFLAIPTHKGDICGPTLHAIQMAATSERIEVMSRLMGLSLLARNFNHLWSEAWNDGYDYFLMLHSDLGVSWDGPGSWIEKLVDRLSNSRAAAISLVVPIKSVEGVTSLALQLQRGNSYTLRRVVVRELDKLPRDYISRGDLCQLFGVEPEQAGAMLINTGCLLMDLKNFAWRNWPGFGIEDRIAFNRDGRAESFTKSEDWRMSEWLFDAGWPYYATNELIANHLGCRVFCNRDQYGLDQDPVPLQLSIEEYEQSGKNLEA